MTTQRQREIVIEFEKIKLIRKRAKTILSHCEGCGKECDFVSQNEAAELFETTPGHLFRFVEQNDCHYSDNNSGSTYLCVRSMLEKLKQQNDTRLLKAIGE